MAFLLVEHKLVRKPENLPGLDACRQAQQPAVSIHLLRCRFFVEELAISLSFGPIVL
jgi:hypothetical protein